MKKEKYSEKIEIPEGITCEISDRTIICKKGDISIPLKITEKIVNIKIEDNYIVFETERFKKKEKKLIKTYVAHLKNNFKGLKEPFVYELEACSVHFPITLKLEKNKLIINNFLGEKKPRVALIREGVDVKIQGQKVIVSSPNKEDAGQTAANIEKATVVKNRDRRVFQDGIFIVSKPKGAR